jgi:hypothetical protein
LLLPDTYTLHFAAVGYDPVTVSGVVVGPGAATQVDVQMVRATTLSADGAWARTILALSLLMFGAVAMRKRPGAIR